MDCAGKSTEHSTSTARDNIVPHGVYTTWPDAMLQNIYNQYIPSLRSWFKESMIGFRKVVMVGFSLENHSPASIIFFLENLYQQKYQPNNLWLQITVLGKLYLCSVHSPQAKLAKGNTLMNERG